MGHNQVTSTGRFALAEGGNSPIGIHNSGDIWATTQAGVSRFKKDRQVWVPMGSDSGLGSRTDVKAIAIDEKGGKRAVYVGGNPGLSVMQTP